MTLVILVYFTFFRYKNMPQWCHSSIFKNSKTIMKSTNFLAHEF